MRDYPQEDVSVFLKEYRNPYMITPHLHTEYEIYYNINGGKGFFIDDHYYDCNPHDLFIIRKMHIHRVAVGDPDNYVRCVISIDSSFIDKLRLLLSDRTALDFLDAVGETLPVKVHLEKEDHEKYMMHIKEYLRLEQAKNSLLLYNGVSVKDTCTSSGFNDCSNFIRTFKKFTGMSPGTIKKQRSFEEQH